SGDKGLYLSHVAIQKGIGDRYLKYRFLGCGYHGLDLDIGTEPFLECCLDCELGCGCHLDAVGSKGQLQQPASEIWQVDALTRRSEEHLLYKLSNVLVSRVLGTSKPVELIWEIDVFAHAIFLCRQSPGLRSDWQQRCACRNANRNAGHNRER